MEQEETLRRNSLIEKVWNRYCNGHPRERFEGDLDSAIAASLTPAFDYRWYVQELPRYRHLGSTLNRLREMTSTELYLLPRDEAVGLISIELYTSLERAALRHEIARAAAEAEAATNALEPST